METVFGYRLGFFGLVAQGWDLSTTDFGRDPRTKARYPWPDGAQEPVEYVVSLIQRGPQAGISTADALREALRLYWGHVPDGFDDGRIALARREVARLEGVWAADRRRGHARAGVPAGARLRRSLRRRKQWSPHGCSGTSGSARPASRRGRRTWPPRAISWAPPYAPSGAPPARPPSVKVATGDAPAGLRGPGAQGAGASSGSFARSRQPTMWDCPSGSSWLV